MTTAELVPSVSIAHMVNARAGVAQRLRQAFALIQEAADIATAGHVGMPRVELNTGYGRHSSGFNIAGARIKTDSRGQPWTLDRCPAAELEKQMQVGIDSCAWQFLMHESGLRSLMDAKARETWDKAIAQGDIPELTDANIRSTFKMLHDSRGEMFERGVIACFKALGWCYKTNLPQKFGKRIVVTHLTSGYSNQTTDRLEDLNRVLHVLDGKPEPDHRSGIAAQLSAGGFSSWSRRVYGVCETTYMDIRTFKNGNGHATFTRPDLVERMNLIIAKHYPGALPAPK
ncbi:MAG TPA: DUF4942 domain-containing protein [Thermomonas sp.]|nr:DUF4942 domain-containing protein [Thermomonas sp.]